MEGLIITILILIVALVAVVAFQLLKPRKTDDSRDVIESFLNQKFIDFSRDLRETMDNARKEVASSKDVLSASAQRTLEHISSMNKTVSSLVAQQEKAEKLGQSLEYLLQAPKLRGNYGETVLEEMLERILPNKGMWERQYTIEGGEKVDAVVKYRDVVVPIDSKFPRDDYQKYIAAVDPAAKKTHWSNYERALKTQINSIKDKYIKPEKGTTEFALLFIPSEAIYYETIAEKNHMDEPCLIYEYAMDRKVIPVSPNTFYAFLQVIIMGIRNIDIAREAKKLQDSLSKVERDFDHFYKRFEFIGKAIENASSAYEVGDGHIKRFKRDLEATLKMDNAFQTEVEKKELTGRDPE